jgi:uncharacterized protein
MNRENVNFTNEDGEKLVGDLYLPSSTSRSGVVFGHCFSCSRHTRILTESCEALYQAGIASLRFDFSGNGQSEGDFAETTYSKHAGEMLAGVDLMVRKGIDKIGLAGHSMGAAIAILTAASSSNISAVCTLAGRYSSTNFDRLLGDSVQAELEENGRVCFNSRNRPLCLNSDFFKDAESVNMTEKTGCLKIPLLAVHGDQDEVIPVEEAYKSREIKPDQTEVLIVENADHMFSNSEHRTLITDHMSEWFSKQLG